jgi:shikimate dehydrogenase
LSQPNSPTDRYAVVGNPVAHSLSPRIHLSFAAQTQQSISYEAIELNPDSFTAQVEGLRIDGLKGLNVTVPFKQQAWGICSSRNPRAQFAGAVNTLIFEENGDVIGDNTDGIGLVRDLSANHQVKIEQCKILILGAGGAVRGVLAPLLEQDPHSITIANRTLIRAQQLSSDFQLAGQINACGYDELGADTYDLVINATAAGLDNQVPPIPPSVLGAHTICYDMMYRLDGPTAFTGWAQEHAAALAIDGLGMLVEQAAESFFIWRGLPVSTAEIIADLRRS